MLLFVPNKVKFSVEEETMLGHLIGVTSGNEANGFTNHFIINSFWRDRTYKTIYSGDFEYCLNFNL